MQKISEILSYHGAPAKRIPLSERSALGNFLATEATRLGIDMPEFYVINHELPNAGASCIKQEGRTIGQIVFSQGYLNRLHNNPDLQYHLPERMKAVIGHEMSHIRDSLHHIDSINLRKLAIFSMPLIALAAYEIYAHALQQRQKGNTLPDKDQIDHSAQQLFEENKTAWNSPLEFLKQDDYKWAKRIAVLTLGAAAGVATARYMSRSAEFRADRAAVVACGYNPELLIEELRNLEKASHDYLKPKLKEWKNSAHERNFWDNAGQAYTAIKDSIKFIATNDYPTFAERAQAMRNFAKSASFLLVR